MADDFYEWLRQWGYSHPLHPLFVHCTIGAVAVAVVLSYAAWLWPRTNLMQSAYHAIVLALVFFFPTVIAGALDWQHFYAGVLIAEIKTKMILACAFLIVLSLTVFIGRKPSVPRGLMRLLYTLCLINSAGLGFFGGKLVFG